jgi:nucleoside-diphosphate-sugar epimerase
MNEVVESGAELKSGSQVVVTGATGYTGHVLVRKLVEIGCQVRVIARLSSDISRLEPLPLQWFRGDVFDQKVVQEAVVGAEYVFHVAAAFREAKSSKQDYWNVHVQSTQLLAREALKQPHFKRFVHVSTVGVHGHIADPPADETYPFRPGDDYQATKAEAEQWLVNFASEQNLPYSVVRPAAIYGPGEKRLLKLYRMARKPVFLILGYGKCWYHLVHVEDLANAMIRVATEERALGEAFIIGSNDSIRLEDMAEIIAESYGKKLRPVRLPITPFFVLGYLCERICRPMGVEPLIFRRRVAFYSNDRSFNTRKMREVLGYEPQYDNRAGILESAKWYRDKGWL